MSFNGSRINKKMEGNAKELNENIQTSNDSNFARITNHGENSGLKVRLKRKAKCVKNYNELIIKKSQSYTSQKPVERKQTKHLPTVNLKSVCILSHFFDLFTTLSEFEKDRKYCDCKILGDSGFIMVHKLVLGVASSELHDLVERSEVDDGITTINLRDIPTWVLENVVTFLYTGKLQVKEGQTTELVRHCERFGLTGLCDKLRSVEDSRERDFDVMLAKVKNYMNNNDQDGICSVTAFERTHTAGSIKNQKNTHAVEGKMGNKKRKVTAFIKSEHDENNSKRNCTAEESENREQMMKSIRNYSDNTVGLSDYIKVEAGTSDIRGTLLETGSKTDVSDDFLKQTSATSEDEEDHTFTCKQTHVAGKKAIRKKNKGEDLDGITGNLSPVYDNIYDMDSLDVDLNEDTDEEWFPEYEINSNLIEGLKNEEGKDCGIKNSSKKETKVSVNKRNGRNNAKCDRLCKVCQSVFTTLKEYKEHKKTCRSSRPRRKCMLCKKQFDTAEEYTEHRQSDPECLKIQKEKRQRRLQKKAELRSQFSCRVCPRKFRRVSDQIEHEFVAHELMYDLEKWPDLSCEWCGYKTLNPWRLHHHQRYDCSKGQDYICDECGNNYRNQKTLKHHKNLVHGNTNPMLTCEQCGKTLKGPSGLERHVRLMHKGENICRKRMCHMCSMKYSNNSDLLLHLYKVHQQPLPDGFIMHNCPECDYITNTKRAYEKHMVLHKDIRDWKCDRCWKAFKTRNSLQTHMKIHLGERLPCPYEDCSYAALKKTHLKAHIENQHTQKGTKNEECHLCDYSTFFKGNLIKHQRTVHNLEVVTRHNVHMKAKYKNLKNGDIVGVISDEQRPKKSNTVKANNKNIGSDENNVTNEQGSAKTEVVENDLKPIISNLEKPDPSEDQVLHQNQHSLSQVQQSVNKSQSVSFTNSQSTQNQSNVAATSMNVVYGFSPTFGNTQTDMNRREVTLPTLFAEKIPAVMPPAPEEQGNKMLTYFQM